MNSTADFLLSFAAVMAIIVGSFLAIMAGLVWIAHRVVEDSYPDPQPIDPWSDEL